MTVAVHQPNYLPWLGYFYKIYASDVFVFHDAVAYSKASYTKRCRIRLAKDMVESTWLSVPVRQHAETTPIAAVQISHATDWATAHLRKIENTYRTAPYFDTAMELLAPAIEVCSKHEFLAHCNTELIRRIAETLGLETQYFKSSQLAAEGNASALNLNLVTHLGGTQYLAGKGSEAYENRSAFQHAGIAVVTHDLGAWLQQHPYDQGTETFANGMSVVDAMMHIGPGAIRQIFDHYHASLRHGPQ